MIIINNLQLPPRPVQLQCIIYTVYCIMWYVPVARIQTLAPNISVECTILQLSLAITWLYQSHVTYLSSSNKTRVAPLVLLLTSVTWPISLPLLVQVAWHIQQDHVTFIKQWERSSSITCSYYFTLVQLYKANHVTQDQVTFMKQWERSSSITCSD